MKHLKTGWLCLLAFGGVWATQIQNAAFRMESPDLESDPFEYRLQVNYFADVEATEFHSMQEFRFHRLTPEDYDGVKDSDYGDYLEKLIEDPNRPVCQLGSMNGHLERKFSMSKAVRSNHVAEFLHYIELLKQDETSPYPDVNTKCVRTFVFDYRASDRTYLNGKNIQEGEWTMAQKLKQATKNYKDSDLTKEKFMKLSNSEKMAYLFVQHDIRYMFVEGSLKSVILNDMATPEQSEFLNRGRAEATSSLGAGFLCQLGKYILDAFALGLKVSTLNVHGEEVFLVGKDFVYLTMEKYPQIPFLERFSGISLGTETDSEQTTPQASFSGPSRRIPSRMSMQSEQSQSALENFFGRPPHENWGTVQRKPARVSMASEMSVDDGSQAGSSAYISYFPESLPMGTPEEKNDADYPSNPEEVFGLYQGSSRRSRLGNAFEDPSEIVSQIVDPSENQEDCFSFDEEIQSFERRLSGLSRDRKTWTFLMPYYDGIYNAAGAYMKGFEGVFQRLHKKRHAPELVLLEFQRL